MLFCTLTLLFQFLPVGTSIEVHFQVTQCGKTQVHQKRHGIAAGADLRTCTVCYVPYGDHRGSMLGLVALCPLSVTSALVARRHWIDDNSFPSTS